MSARIAFRVYGTPAPQGSKRHVGNGIMVESSGKVRPWRQDVKYAALEAHKECGVIGVHFGRYTPVTVSVSFYLQRPKGHHGSGRNAGKVKPSAPMGHGTKPDVDKLVRSTLDALGEADIWVDDSQVAELVARKQYATAENPVGAWVEVSPL